MNFIAYKQLQLPLLVEGMQKQNKVLQKLKKSFYIWEKLAAA